MPAGGWGASPTKGDSAELVCAAPAYTCRRPCRAQRSAGCWLSWPDVGGARMSESAVEKSPSPKTPNSHRVLVAVMLTIATITGFLAIFSTWVNRQALNTDNWTNTSSKLLADDKIQTLLGAYLVNELFSNVDVAGQLRAILPKQAQGLAGPAATGLRGLAERQ